MTRKQKSVENILRAASEQRRQGYNMAIETINSTWGIIIQNMSAELELTAEQTQKLARIKDYFDSAMMGFLTEGMKPEDFAEYLVEKSKQITEELHERWS